MKVSIDFDKWWWDKGSGITPKDDEDIEAFAHRISRIAWLECEYIIRKKALKENDHIVETNKKIGDE